MDADIDEMKIRHLDPKVRIQWALNAMVFAILMWIFVSWLAGLAFPDGLFGVHSSIYPFMFFMIIGICAVPYLVWIELRYKNYTYYVSDTELTIRRGVLRIERSAIPFEKVQNVNVSRTILERILGIATLKIETAGTNPGEAEGIIPGIANYREVVDEILMHVEHLRANHIAAHEKAPSAELDKLLGELSSLRAELQKLRDENQRLKTKNEGEGRQPAEKMPLLEFEGERYKKAEVKRIIPKKAKKGRK